MKLLTHNKLRVLFSISLIGLGENVQNCSVSFNNKLVMNTVNNGCSNEYCVS